MTSYEAFSLIKSHEVEVIWPVITKLRSTRNAQIVMPKTTYFFGSSLINWTSSSALATYTQYDWTSTLLNSRGVPTAGLSVLTATSLNVCASDSTMGAHWVSLYLCMRDNIFKCPALRRADCRTHSRRRSAAHSPAAVLHSPISFCCRSSSRINSGRSCVRHGGLRLRRLGILSELVYHLRRAQGVALTVSQVDAQVQTTSLQELVFKDGHDAHSVQGQGNIALKNTLCMTLRALK